MASRTASVLITGGTLIDGTGAPPVSNAAVLIEGNRITYAGARGSLGDVRSTSAIDASGKTIVPGLIDLHNHSTFDADMRVYIKNGVTSIRFAGLNQDAVVALRDRVTQNALPGPRIFSCGPMLDKTPPAYPRWTSPVNTPAEAAETARRLLADDKVEALLVTQQITPDLLRPVIEAAHAFGRPVVGQIWFTDGREAAELGIDELDNYSRIFVSREYPTARLLSYRSIAERLSLTARGWATIDWDLTEPIMQAMVQYGVSYCPTLVIHQHQAVADSNALEADPDYQAMYGEPERKEWAAFLQYIQGAWTPRDRSDMAAAYDERLEWIRRFHVMGGTVVVGTDMQFGGIMVHQELHNLEAAGLSRMEVVAAATGLAARELGMADSLGTIQPGKLADVLVLNRDPLQDLGALRDIAHVLKDGVIVAEDGPSSGT
jgi:imidazolonepropionase-like amidohydrolase